MEKKNILRKWWFVLLLIVVYTAIIAGITYLIASKTMNKHTVEVGSSYTQNQTVDKNDNESKKTEDEVMKEISVNEKVTEKDWEVTVKETGFKQDIVPSNPNSYYTHYQVKDTSNTYFYIIMEAKNVSSLGLRADSIAKVKMKYDNKYEYTTFSTIEESGGGTFTYTNITSIEPLTTRKLYYLVEVPKTIAEEDKEINVEITVNNSTYKLKIR